MPCLTNCVSITWSGHLYKNFNVELSITTHNYACLHRGNQKWSKNIQSKCLSLEEFEKICFTSNMVRSISSN